jgi:glutamate synthase (NADPH/NADH) large chain
VVVLGRTGRNFAAGMSGGVAYVLDLREGRVNPELVDIEPVTDADVGLLLPLLRRHVEETGSLVAEDLVVEPEVLRARMHKVVPREFRRVTQVLAAAAEEGLDPSGDEVWQRIVAPA